MLSREGTGADAGTAATAAPAGLLEERLLALCREAERIRTQQRGLARLLALADFGDGGIRDKAEWVALLRRAGFDDAAMRAWHAEFGRDEPDGRAAFLAALGLAPARVDEIRRWSNAGPAAPA